MTSDYSTVTRPDNLRRVYTTDANLARKMTLNLGDDYLMLYTTYVLDGLESPLHVVELTEDGWPFLEAALVTWGARQVEAVALEGISRDAAADLAGWQPIDESPIDESMRRHPAGGSTYEVSPVTFKAAREPCYPCKVNARLALAASLGSFVSACIALAAVLVAS